jgi:hypothetical protein
MSLQFFSGENSNVSVLTVLAVKRIVDGLCVPKSRRRKLARPIIGATLETRVWLLQSEAKVTS